MIGVKSKSSSFEPRFSFSRMFRNLDRVQDLVVFCGGVILVLKMIFILADIVMALKTDLDFQTFISQSLFLLILVDLFRLLTVYLKDHRIVVSIAVEVTILCVLREIIVQGLMHIDEIHLFAMCNVLLVLGCLMLIAREVEKKKH
ncbi:MAG: phosphate-starvation-inducible PsiE family protein [Xenococcaceae cyanobacterium MO_167.B27]|nr:phosphate-starvation-inducible PsiE family protein [Xenococcaceae cyanobacterium MO_167.B27]